MAEYVVDCELIPYGDGRVLVLPYSFGGHVHERIVRCSDCYHYGTCSHWCRSMGHMMPPDGYCHRGLAKSGDG